MLGTESGSATIVLLLLFSFGVGLKHAVEPDHIAAVSTIVSQRKDLRTAWIVGGLWGVGHTISLMVAAILVIGLQLRISEWLASVLELSVGIMLIVLGLGTLRRLWRGGGLHWHLHRHFGIAHAHPHVHDSAGINAHDANASTHHNLSFGMKPLIVGMVHGMAGSGALMLLVLATISSPTVGIAYIAIFGVGSIGGMMAMSTIIGLPFHLALTRFSGADRVLTAGAGILSVFIGVIWAVEHVGSFW